MTIRLGHASRPLTCIAFAALTISVCVIAERLEAEAVLPTGVAVAEAAAQTPVVVGPRALNLKSQILTGDFAAILSSVISAMKA